MNEFKSKTKTRSSEPESERELKRLYWEDGMGGWIKRAKVRERVFHVRRGDY